VRNGKIHEELLGKFESSEKNSIDQILPEVDRSNIKSVD